MSQPKLKFKEEQDQPSITEYWNTPKEQHRGRTRSTSRKRKAPLTPTSEEKKKNTKRQIKISHSKSEMATNGENPDGLIQNEEKDNDELSLLDQSIVKALEFLLKPIRSDIKDLRNELKQDIVDSRQLMEENRKLHHRVQQVESKNTELSKRLCELENKLLESNVILHGIEESAWETEVVQQEKIYLAISETLIGRMLDERLDTAQGMIIKGSRWIGPYRAMRMRPISIEFMYKSDADYLLTNRKYLSRGVFVDKEYCRETEECRRILRPYLCAARKLPCYHKKCRLEEDTLVLQVVSYTKDDPNRLPEELSGFKISSKTKENKFGFYGNMNPLAIFIPQSSSLKEEHLIALNSSYSFPRPSFSKLTL